VIAETVRTNDRQVIEAGKPIQFKEAVHSLEGERVYVSAKSLLRDTFVSSPRFLFMMWFDAFSTGKAAPIGC
jgi:hypothetical protein